jgi:hemoglobin
METKKEVPTPYEWAGGMERFEQLTEVFYGKVLKDPILEPVFRHMSPEHSRHVAHFLAEVFMGPTFYSDVYGDDSIRHMVGKHIGKKLTEAQRKRWVELLLESADEIGLPSDPEFRSTFVGHIEWGTRVALINSQLDENPVTEEETIPTWGWGEVQGPYGYADSLFLKKKRA